MSSSEPASKIDFDDSNKEIDRKINKAYSIDGKIEGNGLLAILKYIIFRKLDAEGRPFVVNRPEKWGGDITFTTYEQVEAAFGKKEGEDGVLVSADLKPAVAKEIKALLTPLREAIQQPTNLGLYYAAYPNLKPAPPKAAQAKKAGADFSALDVRVGEIVSVRQHENADSLYVEEIDVGEEKPRVIVSGLVKHVPIDQMQGARVLVLCNLQPADVRGVTSNGMVLAVSTADKSKVTLPRLPEGVRVGEKIRLDDCEGESDEPYISKGRLAKVQKGLSTDAQGVPMSDGKPLLTSAGPCSSDVPNGIVS